VDEQRNSQISKSFKFLVKPRRPLQQRLVAVNAWWSSRAIRICYDRNYGNVERCSTRQPGLVRLFLVSQRFKVHELAPIKSTPQWVFHLGNCYYTAIQQYVSTTQRRLCTSVEHDPVSGSCSNRILQFRTGSGSDWISKKSSRCQAKFLTSVKFLTYYCLSVILLLKVRE